MFKSLAKEEYFDVGRLPAWWGELARSGVRAAQAQAGFAGAGWVSVSV